MEKDVYDGFFLPQPWESILDVGRRQLAFLEPRHSEQWAALAISKICQINREIVDYYWKHGINMSEWACPYANSECFYVNAFFRLKGRGRARRYKVLPHMLIVVQALILVCAQELEDMGKRSNRLAR